MMTDIERVFSTLLGKPNTTKATGRASLARPSAQ
jgi:hypothetical protein